MGEIQRNADADVRGTAFLPLGYSLTQPTDPLRFRAAKVAARSYGHDFAACLPASSRK
jgi:hypothetical protein